jgi:hypothetical protein
MRRGFLAVNIETKSQKILDAIYALNEIFELQEGNLLKVENEDLNTLNSVHEILCNLEDRTRKQEIAVRLK